MTDDAWNSPYLLSEALDLARAVDADARALDAAILGHKEPAVVLYGAQVLRARALVGRADEIARTAAMDPEISKPVEGSILRAARALVKAELGRRAQRKAS